MDYEDIRAIVNAVLKKWQDAQQATFIPTEANTAYLSYGQVQVAGEFAKQVLEQVKTSFDIQEGQV